VRGADASLAAALAATGRDYAALASAARSGDEAAYAQAQHALGADRAHAAGSLAALGQAGYAVSG
jgi:hypothetical protein